MLEVSDLQKLDSFLLPIDCCLVLVCRFPFVLELRTPCINRPDSIPLNSCQKIYLGFARHTPSVEEFLEKPIQFVWDGDVASTHDVRGFSSLEEGPITMFSMIVTQEKQSFI